MLNFVKAYGADWDFDYSSPLDALKEGIECLSPALARSYAESLRANGLSIEQLQEALNVAFDSSEGFQRFVDDLISLLDKQAVNPESD